MAIYWPTPGLKGRTFKLCVLTRWDFNFCVRSSPLRVVQQQQHFPVADPHCWWQETRSLQDPQVTVYRLFGCGQSPVEWLPSRRTLPRSSRPRTSCWTTAFQAEQHCWRTVFQWLWLQHVSEKECLCTLPHQHEHVEEKQEHVQLVPHPLCRTKNSNTVQGNFTSNRVVKETHCWRSECCSSEARGSCRKPCKKGCSWRGTKAEKGDHHWEVAAPWRTLQDGRRYWRASESLREDIGSATGSQSWSPTLQVDFGGEITAA